ncbi:hypothetical protein COU57_03825 [Candidatus Pacearchaeota archaeon CG10_big_fil_rev_8_21_14_0_10_32_14]|nr:MAG: hypothetical protein COU57_03825 [Candidatus Pacearchaeota archaeon CG10_big_fil_rev_8_21_14_0_10_32_14]
MKIEFLILAISIFSLIFMITNAFAVTSNYPPVCGNGICEINEANDPGGCGPNADPGCLGSPAKLGTCSRDCSSGENGSYLSCGCGCCSFSEPLEKIAQEKCFPEGKTLDDMRKKDNQLSTEQCALAGCSYPIKYVYCKDDKKVCVQDSDCKLIYGPCNCLSVLKNDSRTSYDEGNIQCVWNQCLGMNVSAVCKNNKCVKSSGENGIENQCPFGKLDSQTCSYGYEVEECSLEGKTVYIIANNVFDGGSILYDSNGLGGECVQGFSGKAIGKCKDLNFSTCKVIHRTSPNIWGTSAVNRYNCDPCSLTDDRQFYNMSNGRNAEIKIMPSVASETAIEKLGDLGFNITLKEVGKGDNAKVVYDVSGEKEGKMFGLFKVKGKVSVEVDVETGDVVRVHKPWWAFLASGL